jgi:hypothetical protein
VNGQVVGIDEPFHLTGTPRWADDMLRPPFHWYCRTAVAPIHRDEVNDSTTVKMREAAQAELKARADVAAQEERLEKRLAALGERPDIRVRKDDSDAVRGLRNELRMWRARARVEIHPAHATSRRG